MRHALATILLLSASVGLASPPSVTGPDKVYGEAGDWVEVKVATTGKSVKFVPLDPGLKLFPADKLRDPLATMVSASEPKSYRLLCYTGTEDGPSDPLVITAVFGPAAPGPNPPNPPPPPKPVDPKYKALKDAFDAEPVPMRQERVRVLAAVMKGAAALSADATVTNNGTLAARVARDTESRVGPLAESLTTIRKVIGEQLKAEFSTDLVTLTPALRAKFAAEYGRIATTLEEFGR